MRRSPVLIALVGATLLGAAPAGSVLPRPAEIRSLAPDAGDDLVLTPAVSIVALGPNEGATVSHLLANGGDATLDLDLAAVPVVPGRSGEPVPSQAGGGGAISFLLADDAVQVGPREVATLTSALRAGPALDGWEAFRVSATTSGAAPGTAVQGYVVAGPAAPPPAVGVTARLDGAATPLSLEVVIDNPGARHAVVDLRVRVGAWWGPTVLDRTVRDVLVWPGASRTLTVPLTGETVPGRYGVEVVAADRHGPSAHATASAWVWRQSLLAIVAAALVLVTALLVWRALRRG